MEELNPKQEKVELSPKQEDDMLEQGQEDYYNKRASAKDNNCNGKQLLKDHCDYCGEEFNADDLFPLEEGAFCEKCLNKKAERSENASSFDLGQTFGDIKNEKEYQRL